MYNENIQQNPLLVEPYVTEEFSISRRFSPMIFDPHANSVLLRAHLCTEVLLLAHLSLYSGINRLYAQNPVFEIVHDESVKAYLHIYTTGMFTRTL